MSTPFYLQGNIQDKATNKTIIDGLKKRLEEKKDALADKLDILCVTSCLS